MMAGEESNTLDLQCGVPQGPAVLSPVPLNIHIKLLNEIAQSLDVGFHSYV